MPYRCKQSYLPAVKDMYRTCAILLLVVLAPTYESVAQSGMYFANLGGGRAGGEWGALFGLDIMRHGSGPLWGEAGFDAVVRHVDPEGYYRDTFSTGGSRCRDSETGRFAADEKCSAAEYVFGLNLAADALIRDGSGGPESFLVGLGYRASIDPSWFATLGYLHGSTPGLGYLFKVSAGPSILRASIGIGVIN